MALHLLFDLLAYLIAGVLSWRYLRAPKISIDEEELRWRYYTVLIVGGVVGSVGASMLNTYLSLGERVIVGKSILGAIAGATVSVELFKRHYRIKGSTGAYFIPSLAIGIAIGRIGCFMVGLEDYTYGIPTNLPWGVDFGDGIARHPVQFYESAAMFGFFLFSLWLYRHNRYYFEAKVFYLFVLFYATQRFVWEFLKPYAAVALGLNLFQVIALLLIVYAMIYLKRSAHGPLHTKV